MNRLPICTPYMCAVSLLVVFASGACSPSEQPAVSSAAAQVRCDTFKIVQSLDGDTLTVSLETDLPDFTDVMVSVSRSYFEKNSPDEYSRNYFQEKSTIGRWRQPRQIKVSHDTFKASLQEHQRKMSQAGIAGEIDRIGTDVVIDFTVPINQTNTAFGNGNANLTGAATTTSGSWRIVKSEAREPYPLDAKGAAGPQWGNWNALVEGGTYRLSRETPLMSALNPPDPLEAIAGTKLIPAKGSITVNEAAMKDGDRWYRVEARVEGRAIGAGWVNSNALIGQQLQVLGGGR